MRMNEKYQKKDIYLQKKDNKLWIKQGQCNNIIMKYQKIINFLDNPLNQPFEFITKYCF